MRRAKHTKMLSDTSRWTVGEESKAHTHTFRHSEVDDG